MKSFYDKNKYTQSDIESLIGEEENLNLEFKGIDSLSKENKIEISKDVSAFANSSGGIIIYGINEEKHIAKDISFVDGDKITKEWIENVISGNIQRRLNHIEIIPIRFDDDLKKSIYLIKVQASSNSPHMCGYKKFYKRNNFENIPMEEYEVRESYNRILKTKLCIGESVFRFFSKNGIGSLLKVKNKVRFELYNIGDYIEKNFKLQISIPEQIIPSEHNDSIKQYYMSTINNNSIYSISNKDVLFPEEQYTVCHIVININRKIFLNLDNTKIYLKLFYSGGKD